MKKNLFVIIATASLMFSNAWAIDLGTAKNNGLVGESPTGYLEVVKNPSAEVKALINDINNKRRSKYQSIAQKNGASLQAVEVTAGQSAIKKTRAGHFVKINGKWIKK